ncbi:MAG: RNA polymerase sigma factor RpoD/SigA [Treponema sp.]|nr:RNA polymerase sigma factor RpoD/SigA [Treponema sp.]
MRGIKNLKKSDGIYKTYFEQIKRIPLLTAEEELELSRLIQKGDDGARRQLIEANLRLVVKIARSYFAHDVPCMDLVQEGNMGLIRAAEKYDHLKQVRFSTYATWWIRQAIGRSLEEKRRAIRLPRNKEDVFRKIQKTSHTLSQRFMRQPRAKEIAVEIGVSCEDVELLIGVTQSCTLIDSEGDYTYNPERVLLKKSSQEAAFQALDTLNDREKNIIMCRYQLNGLKRRSLKNIGAKMGISTETVRQIEFRALRKLRSHAQDLLPCIEAM